MHGVITVLSTPICLLLTVPHSVAVIFRSTIFAPVFSYICIFYRNFALLICILNAACRKCIFIIRVIYTFSGPAKLCIQFRWKIRRSSAALPSALSLPFAKRICKCIFRLAFCSFPPLPLRLTVLAAASDMLLLPLCHL